MANLNNISNLSVQLQTTRLMRSGREQLFNLQAQIASGKKTSDSSTLGATNSRGVLNSRTAVARYENYMLAIKTVDVRLKVQSQVLTDTQDMVQEMTTLINSSQTYQAATDLSAGSQFQSYLARVGINLNQRVGDRQLFAGGRFSTEPARSLTTLPVPPTEAFPFTPVTSPAVPLYDVSMMTESAVTSMAANNGASTLTLGSSTWADQGYEVGDTITLTGMSAGANNATFTISSLAGGVATVTPAPTTQAADASFVGMRNSPTEQASSYDEDGVYIDDNFLVTYGVSSNDPAFQNLIMGMRWAYAATQDQTNYTVYMDRANTLISTARDQLRVLEAETAANQGLMDKTLSSHKESLVLYQNEESNIIDANVEEAATLLTILSAQIEASFAATGRIINLSITDYI